MTSDQRRVFIADEHFTTGYLLLAEPLCIELREEKIRSPMLTALLAEILLLRNRPADAEPLLRKAVDEQGGNPRLLGSLAECLRRSDRLSEAAELYRNLGRIALADKLHLLADGGQYLLPDDAAVSLPWASHTELPLVEAHVIGAAVGLPFSTAEAAEVEVARHIEGTGFGISSAMRARPFLCRSLEAAGARLADLPGMLIGKFRLEHQFGFRIGGLLGDEFVNTGALALDFGTMRLALEQ